MTTNTTLFDGADPNSVRAFFDEVMSFGVEGMVLSPGYTYDKAPDQKHFLGRARSRRLFRAILSNRRKEWKFNMSPLFLEFLMGKRDYQCTPWGSPAFNIFGWQKPCYLLQDGYADTYRELIETTDWSHYGTESGNPKCANCMVSCGYEPSTVHHGFTSLSGFWGMVKAHALQRLPGSRRTGPAESADSIMAAAPLVQIASTAEQGVGRIARMSEQTDTSGTALAPGHVRKSLPDLSTSNWRAGFRNLHPSEEELRIALEKAFDYRGDITIDLERWQHCRRLCLRSPVCRHTRRLRSAT